MPMGEFELLVAAVARRLATYPRAVTASNEPPSAPAAVPPMAEARVSDADAAEEELPLERIEI
jgi:hypothetical protein